jgi:ribosomal protein L40E
MPEKLIRIGKATKLKLEMVAEVEETSVSAIINEAIRDYMKELDWPWYTKQIEKLKDEKFEEEPEPESKPKDEEIKVCDKCEEENWKEAKFCVHCGAKFEVEEEKE